MQNLSGRLLYTKFFMPWKFITDNGEMIDIKPIINKFLASIDGKCVNHKLTFCDYTITVEDGKPRDFFGTFPGELVSLEHQEDFCRFNVDAELSVVLDWFSGQIVEIEIEDGKHFVIMVA